MRNKKGFTTPITIFFMVLAFVIGWALVFGPMLATWGADAVENNNLSGVEALFYYNLNVLIFVVLVIFILAYLYLGAGA